MCGSIEQTTVSPLLRVFESQIGKYLLAGMDWKNAWALCVCNKEISTHFCHSMGEFTKDVHSFASIVGKWCYSPCPSNWESTIAGSAVAQSG